jgi:hypothetical protein
MDAETMTNDRYEWRDGKGIWDSQQGSYILLNDEHHARILFAALRAQAEPVGDVCKVAFGGPHFARLFNPGELPVGTKLYTAPPPDHAEALAEALEEMVSKTGPFEGSKGREVRTRARAALTRYKESRNG